MLALVLLAAPPVAPAPRPVPPVILARTAKEVEGWAVHVDNRLLDGPDADLGAKALRVLAFKLYEIKQVVPADRVARLQKVGIVLDHGCPRLSPMQYHPSVGWLRANAHDPFLAKKVHIPQARDLAGRMPVNQQPMVILHELAHAYHDQVLGFDHAQVKAAWARYKEGGKGDKVRHIGGRESKHYALTNPMEFFAEMTEAYFGTNDFYPFVRGELQKELPEVYDLLGEVWGKP